MTDTLILISQILGATALIGAVFVVWQLIQIRFTLGPFRPFWRTELGTIITDHVLAGFLWMLLLFGYYLMAEFGDLPSVAHGWIQLWLLLLIWLIIWVFGLRAHLWYRRRD